MRLETWLSQLEAFSRRGIYIWFFTACCSLWGKSIIYWHCDHFGNLIINYLLPAFKFTRAAGKNFCVFREMQNNLCAIELYIWVRNCSSYVTELLLSQYVIAPWSPYSSFSRYMFFWFSEAKHWCLNSNWLCLPVLNRADAVRQALNCT